MGGLGNQMFQYAAGRRLAYFLATDLKLDISGFEKDPLRNYALGVFNIQEHFAKCDEVIALKTDKRWKFIRIAERVFPSFVIPQPTYIKERQRHFDKRVLSLSDNIYLDGYWQSEKYFLDISDIILKEFTVKSSQTDKNKELAKLITSCNAVSIHIRRADYVSSPSANKILGTLDLNYYKRCVNQLNKILNKPHFFIFSDQPEWIRDNLKLPYPIRIIAHNGREKYYEDLRLMCQCRHHIIANSTFSWWGAWLNPRSDKIVFAPKYWCVDKNFEPKDLIPDVWVRI